jgi:tetratricopeptide (TPR) repeat protein
MASRTAASWVIALSLALPRLALAQDTTRADETFHAGRELMKDGKLAEACPKFEESQRADPASGTLLALAYCQELSGLLASAHANYVAAADLAAKEGQSERQKASSERAEGLQKRVSTLTILVPSELSQQAGLKIKRDGIELDRTTYNVGLPLNGGTHAIEVTAPGRERWAGVVTLQTEADHKTLQLPMLQAESAQVLELTPSTQPSRTWAPIAAAPIESKSVRRMRQTSVGLGLASAVGVGLGVTFGLAAKSRNDASNRDGHCDNTGCDAYGAGRREAALDAARVATWSFVAAGALGATAIILYFKAENTASTQLATSVVGGVPRVTLSGSF